MTAKNTREVSTRLPLDIIAELEKRAKKTYKGRSGGLSAYLRHVVYEHLGLTTPREYGDAPAGAAERAQELQAEGLTLQAIGLRLAEEGHRPARGGESWSPTQVRRLLPNRAVTG